MQELGIHGLCELLNSYTNRSAVAHVCFGLYDGKELLTFEAQITGTIARAPSGDNDFGWGPTFIPDGYTKTWGEMSIEEQYQQQ